MEEAPDAQLVAEIGRGGEHARAAEAALCRRFAARIRLYGLRHLRDEERARELVQSVLLAVLEAARAGRIAAPEQLARFVLGTCRNSALRMRSQARRTEPASDELLSGLSEEAPFELAPTEGLLRCMEQLDDRTRQVLIMTFQEERSAEEIASSLATSAGNVRVLRHRALHSLRLCLDAREVRA